MGEGREVGWKKRRPDRRSGAREAARGTATVKARIRFPVLHALWGPVSASRALLFCTLSFACPLCPYYAHTRPRSTPTLDAQTRVLVSYYSHARRVLCARMLYAQTRVRVSYCPHARLRACYVPVSPNPPSCVLLPNQASCVLLPNPASCVLLPNPASCVLLPACPYPGSCVVLPACSPSCVR